MMYMMKVMIQVKFWIGICTIIIIYSTDFLLHTLHGGHNLKKKSGQKIINTCMDIIIINSSTWLFHPETSYSITLFETDAQIGLFHSTYRYA